MQYALRPGVVIVPDHAGGLTVLTELEEKCSFSPLLIEVLTRLPADEEALVEALAAGYPAEEVYFALICLEKQGLIMAADAARDPVAVFHSALNGRATAETPLVIKVLAVGGHDPTGLITALARSSDLRPEHADAISPGALNLVLTPSCLHPALAELGRAVWECGARWMPIQIRGIRPCIGPLFDAPETGCCECLLDRMRGHRQGRANLAASETQASRDAITSILIVELEKLARGAASQLTGAALTLDFRTLSLVRHPLTRRPQCPLCGAGYQPYRLVDGLPDTPFVLESRRKAEYRDNGERICTATETLERYAHLVDSMTGVVGAFHVPGDRPSGIGHVVVADCSVRGEPVPPGLPVKVSRSLPIGRNNGKGATIEQARASALAESIERYSMQHEGYEPCVSATAGELSEIAIAPDRLMGFSERQYREPSRRQDRWRTDFVPEPYDPSRAIDWTPAWSLTEARWRLVPSAFVYYRYPLERGGDFCRGDSNGAAAGNCREEAILQGLFELVERDAVALWWYHRVRRPGVDWRTLGSPLTSRVAEALEKRGERFEVLDLTHDLGLPVFAANRFHSDGRFSAIGFGCHADPLIALDRAVSELVQSWDMERDENFGAAACRLSDSEEFLLPSTSAMPRTAADFAYTRCDDLRDDIESLVARFRSQGLEILVVDLTRPDILMPVVRVIVPGLVHWWPRLGCRRLYEAPRALGWITTDVDEADLNPAPPPW